MSVDDIATVTRIPVRSLERLESGLFEELPADVFVRGFLRSYARCVGLDAEEIIRRYTQCGMPPAPVCSPEVGEIAEESAGNVGGHLAGHLDRQRGSEPRAMPIAHVTPATEDDKVRPVPSARSGSRHGAEDEQLANESRAEQVVLKAVEPVAPVEQRMEPATEQPKRKRKRRRRKQRRDETSVAQPAQHVHAPAEAEPPLGPAPVESAVQATQVAGVAHGAGPTSASSSTSGGRVGTVSTSRAGTAVERAAHSGAVPVVSDGVPQPVTGRVHARSQSARLQTSQTSQASQNSGRVRASTVTARPVLIIDDEHPEDAERSQEERVERSDATWRSFLPPSLLDSDDGSHRGTLTLAVIILVIVATLTMSYLLRRPNVSGDGVTWHGPAPGQTGETSNPRA